MTSALAPAPAPEAHTIPALDGLPLGALLFRPAASQAIRAVVQLNPATGAKRGYYEPFAHYLAEAGFAVCLWV